MQACFFGSRNREQQSDESDENCRVRIADRGRPDDCGGSSGGAGTGAVNQTRRKPKGGGEMKLEFSKDELRPLVAEIVTEVLERFDGDGRLAWDESEAAKLIGVARHVLRDARLTGKVQHGRCGRKILYSRRQLLDFVEGNGEA